MIEMESRFTFSFILPIISLNHVLDYHFFLKPVTLSNLRLLTVQYRNSHIFHQYVIRVSERDQLRQLLPSSPSLTRMLFFFKYQRGDLPVSEKPPEKALALPIYPELTEDKQMFVVESIKAFYTK